MRARTNEQRWILNTIDELRLRNRGVHPRPADIAKAIKVPLPAVLSELVAMRKLRLVDYDWQWFRVRRAKRDDRKLLERVRGLGEGE